MKELEITDLVDGPVSTALLKEMLEYTRLMKRRNKMFQLETTTEDRWINRLNAAVSIREAIHA